MFSLFSENKTQYSKGQIFPFLIALLAILIIFIMITVNLGQIGTFRTEVSNAADAGALAAAAALSTTLLSYGLRSDRLAGRTLEFMVAVLVDILLIIPTFGLSLGSLFSLIVSYIAEMLVTQLQILDEGKIAFGNAKKNAVSYAFSNAGIDQPKPTFKMYYENLIREEREAGLLSLPDSIEEINDWYLKDFIPDSNFTGATPKQKYTIRGYSRSGFSRFMEDQVNGFFPYQIGPAHFSPPIITSGYGWGKNGDPWQNSYDNRDNYNNIDYKNYVEVTVTGKSSYPVMLYPLGLLIWQTLGCVIDEKIIPRLENSLPWWLVWIATAILNIIRAILTGLLSPLPIGLFFLQGGEQRQVDENYITVEVKRYKKDASLGLWNFRYGDGITAKSQGRAFCDPPPPPIWNPSPDDPYYCTIKATIAEPQLLCDKIWYWVTGNPDYDWGGGFFDTGRHLFETELEVIK